MGVNFEVLDHQATPMGDISLRRRRDPRLDVDVYEVKLGDEYLMSSMFPEAERELARLALAQRDGDALRIVVGGLGGVGAGGVGGRAGVVQRGFFSSRRRHTRCREVSWARRCV